MAILRITAECLTANNSTSCHQISTKSRGQENQWLLLSFISARIVVVREDGGHYIFIMEQDEEITATLPKYLRAKIKKIFYFACHRNIHSVYRQRLLGETMTPGEFQQPAGKKLLPFGRTTNVLRTTTKNTETIIEQPNMICTYFRTRRITWACEMSTGRQLFGRCGSGWSTYFWAAQPFEWVRFFFFAFESRAPFDTLDLHQSETGVHHANQNRLLCVFASLITTTTQILEERKKKQH